MDKLAEAGAEVGARHLNTDLRKDEGVAELLDAVDGADLVVLSAPLYVDGAPAAVVKAMSLIAQAPSTGRGRLVAISNCGFPEARHNETALAIYRHFARDAGFEWAGGLAVGGGGVFGGRSLPEAGGMARGMMAALDRAAEALAAGGGVPGEIEEAVARPAVPPWLYRLVGNFGWLAQARSKGVLIRLNARPYR
jgi:hypothetical protein